MAEAISRYFGMPTTNNDSVAIEETAGHSVTTTYKELTTIDFRDHKELGIMVHNAGATNGAKIKVYGSMKHNPSDIITVSEWFNLISIFEDEDDGTAYDADAEVSLSTGRKIFWQFQDPFAWISLRAKADAGTTTLKYYARLTN